MKLLAILNNEIPLGKSLNALAHLSVGLGHRLKTGTPGVDVYFANTHLVRQFRALAQQTCAQFPEAVVCADFTNTMTEDTAIEQLARTKKTPEADLTYFAACIVASTDHLAPFANLLSQCTQLENYQAAVAQDEVMIGEPQAVTLPAEAPDNKMSMVLSKKFALAQMMNPLVISSLNIGRKADLTGLHLLQFMDADGNIHPNISFHPFPIVTASKPAKHTDMAKNALNASGVAADAQYAANGTPIVLVAFGARDKVDAVIKRKETSMYRADLTAEKFANAVKKTDGGAPDRLFSNSSASNDQKDQVEYTPASTSLTR